MHKNLPAVVGKSHAPSARAEKAGPSQPHGSHRERVFSWGSQPCVNTRTRHLSDQGMSDPKRSRGRSRSPQKLKPAKSPADPMDTAPSKNARPSTSTSANELRQIHSFLLSDFEVKYSNHKLLYQRLLAYTPSVNIDRLIYTRNGVIIKSLDPNFATTIRDKASFEIFGKNAKITKLSPSTIKQTPPPPKQPMLSVVIRGVLPEFTDDEIHSELRQEDLDIHKCIRIKGNHGPTYMVCVLSQAQETIDHLLRHGAFIYKKNA